MAKLSIKGRSFQFPKFTFVRQRFSSLTGFIQRRPVASFIAALVILFALIAVGNIFFKAKPQEVPVSNQAKQVHTFTIGKVPRVSTQAQIQNSGVITIVAQSPGVVQTLNVQEGQPVSRGANLITLSSNYAGGNAPAIQASIAAKQYQQTVDTFDTQKQLIAQQRDVANTSAQNTSQLRDISGRSLVDLRAIEDLNNALLNTARNELTRLEAISTNPDTDPAVTGARQTLNQLQVAQNQTHQQVLNVEFQTNPSNPPSQLADLQKDITLKQLDLQEKSLQTSKDIAALQLSLANIGASMLHPTAPFGAKVEKVLVREGQAVNPGTPLLILQGTKQNITAVAKVPANMAKQISQIEDSTIHLGNSQVAVKPSFISDAPTDGLLYSVIYEIPDGYNNDLTDNEYITVDIPVGVADTTSITPFVPLDSIFQTQDHSYLYVQDHGVAKTKTVTLGTVQGNYVEVTNGLTSGDEVILDRNVVEGDKVQVSQ